MYAKTRTLSADHQVGSGWSRAEIAERMEYLAGLKPNWDGYGGKRITRAAIEKCKSLLSEVDGQSTSRFGVPFIAPMADGGLELEWGSAEKEFMLVIPPEGTRTRYLATSIDGTVNEDGVLPDGSSVSAMLRSNLS